MSRIEAEVRAERDLLLRRPTVFFHWLERAVGGEPADQRTIVDGVVEQMHQVRLVALSDALSIAQSFLDRSPTSEEMRATFAALYELADAQRQLVEANRESAAS